MKSQTQTPSRTRGRLHEEGGWTLVELLVGLVLMLVVVFAALPIVEGATNTTGRIQTAAESIGEARTFADHVLRDLRPANAVPVFLSNQVTVDTWVRHVQCGDSTASAPNASPIQCQVTYRCSGTSPDVSCTRQEQGGPVVTEVTGLDDSNIFTYVINGDPPPAFVSIKLKLPNPQNSDSGNANGAIELHDGTALRNTPGVG
jgi:type II secretory pathway pseudopilin PulG